MIDPLLGVRSLKKYFTLKKGFLIKERIYVKAVGGTSFPIPRGESFGLMAESGARPSKNRFPI